MRVEARLLQRDFSTPLAFQNVYLEPVRYSWHAIGGPEECELRAVGSAQALWEMMEWLRSPVELLDERGMAVWWGVLTEVTIGVGGMELGLSLDAMANRIKVIYDDKTSGAAVRTETAWLEDADSVATYGTFERLVALSDGSAEMANALRYRVLAELRYPAPVMRHVPDGSLGATLRAVGWWQSLGWQYYGNSVADLSQTTDQLYTVLTENAQYITGNDIMTPSELSVSQFRDGTQTALQVVEGLLSAGMSDGSGLLARVTRDRIAYVYPEPTEDHLWLLADGRVSNRWGDPELTHTCPVGEWCLLQGAIPPTVNVSRIADASRFFVQRSEYTPADGRLILEPRGARSPWDLSPPAPDRGESVGAAGFVGRREGPHFGMFAIENQDDGSWSVLGRAVDTANTPFFSVGERNYVPNTKWAYFGYRDKIHIRLKDSTSTSTDPEEHTDVYIPPAALDLDELGEALQIGDVAGGDYAQFAPDGRLTLVGAARYIKHVSLDLSGLGQGPSAPAVTRLGNTYGYAFDIGENGYVSFEMPHDWDSATDLEIALHIYTDEAYATNSGEIRFKGSWSAIAEDVNEAIDSPTHSGTMTGSDMNIATTAKGLQEYIVGSIPAASLAADDMVSILIERIALTAGNNPTADPVVIQVEYEYYGNSLGEAP